ncbi:hemolysin family protein [Propionicicella superfundia]|uniref:hemolysin family protein n=1 Tax=Propionicicella superfundia TaxID=348582 RepID=UPI0004246DAC|nr:hemolysin family protein [Propionicicella superfundia]
MTETDWLLLALALAGVLVAGLLALVEAALQTVSKSRARRLAEEGRRGAARLLTMTQDPAPYLNTVYFTRGLCEVTAVVLVSTVVFSHVSELWLRLLIPIAAMFVVSFIGLGVAPRTLGRQNAERVALAGSGPVNALNTVLGPIPQLMILIGNVLTPGRGFSDGPFSSEAELRELVDMAEASSVIEAGERRMIHSVFDLGDTIVKEVMVPRTEMVYIESHKTLRQAVSLALRSGFSRIPVIGEDLDDIAGVLYLKDVIRRVYDNAQAQSYETVDSVMRPAIFCPDSKPVDDLLREMQRTRSHVVLVVDEFGGTAGLATIEDILEEIVGEIVDEYDEEIPPYVELGDGRFRVSARLGIDDLGELFGRKLDDDDVDTVLGLMAKELNLVPIPGSIVQWEGLELTAERASGRRHTIETVLVRECDDHADADGDPGIAAATQLAVDAAERAS